MLLMHWSFVSINNSTKCLKKCWKSSGQKNVILNCDFLREERDLRGAVRSLLLWGIYIALTSERVILPSIFGLWVELPWLDWLVLMIEAPHGDLKSGKLETGEIEIWDFKDYCWYNYVLTEWLLWQVLPRQQEKIAKRSKNSCNTVVVHATVANATHYLCMFLIHSIFCGFR